MDRANLPLNTREIPSPFKNLQYPEKHQCFVWLRNRLPSNSHAVPASHTIHSSSAWFWRKLRCDFGRPRKLRMEFMGTIQENSTSLANALSTLVTSSVTDFVTASVSTATATHARHQFSNGWGRAAAETDRAGGRGVIFLLHCYVACGAFTNLPLQIVEPLCNNN